MNDIRDRFGIEATPISVQALRQAIEGFLRRWPDQWLMPKPLWPQRLTG